MFVGSVPRPVVDQILRAVDFGAWGSVHVCCSGSFRVDRAIKAGYPACRVISNDVSLFSVALGRLLTGQSVDVCFTGRLAFIEGEIGTEPLDRTAAVMVAVDMARYRGKNEWAQTHFAHYETAFADFLGRALERLDTMLAGPRPDGFVAGDFRQMPALAGRSLITQTWDMDLDRFPAWAIEVPRPRLLSVESIKHVDTDGVLRTLDASGYRVDAKREPGRITPAYGEVWPATRAVMNAVTVRFKAGYGDEAETVPADIRQALLLIVGRHYAHREDVRDGMPASELPLGAQHLLRPYMIPRV